MIAKLCSTAFKKTSRRILEDVRGNFAVPPGTQPEAMESEDLRVGMKRAAEDIARSKFVIYNFSPVFQWGRALSDTAAAAVRTGASVAAAPVCTSTPGLKLQKAGDAMQMLLRDGNMRPVRQGSGQAVTWNQLNH